MFISASDKFHKELLAEVTEAVTTAVTYTSQTHVDVLKKGGIFDKEVQMEALQKSKDKTLFLPSTSARHALADIYGDFDAYLETKIEAEARAQKQHGDVIILGEPFTAAAVVQTTVSQVDPVGGAGSPVEGGAAPGNVNSRPRLEHHPTGRETGGNRPGSNPLPCTRV